MTLAVQGQQSAGAVQFHVVADRGKQVEDFAVVRFGVAHAVCGEHGQLQRARNADRCLISPLLLALPVALHFDVDISVAEDARELLHNLAPGLFTAACERRG